MGAGTEGAGLVAAAWLPPPQPSPARGGGGQGRGGPWAPPQPSLAGGEGAPRSASAGPFPRLRGKVGMGAAPQARLLLPSPGCPHPALPRGRGRGPRAWRAVCPTPTLPRGRGGGTTIRMLRPTPPLAGAGLAGARAAGALAASVVWLPPPRPAPARAAPASGAGGEGRGGLAAPHHPSPPGGACAPRRAAPGPCTRLRGHAAVGPAPQARLLLPSPGCPHPGPPP